MGKRASIVLVQPHLREKRAYRPINLRWSLQLRVGRTFASDETFASDDGSVVLPSQYLAYRRADMAMTPSNPLLVLTSVIDLKRIGALLNAMILASQSNFCSWAVKPPPPDAH